MKSKDEEINRIKQIYIHGNQERPVSPRQKMINLMYVILMAMLALNTPTDEEFGVKGKSVVEKIKKSLADDGKKSDEEKKI